jgi:acetyl-CoA C-acetyltransferase
MQRSSQQKKAVAKQTKTAQKRSIAIARPANNRLRRTVGQLSAKKTTRKFSTQANIQDNDVCIVSAVRTPMASFGGALSTLSAVELGSIAIKAAVQKSGINADDVNEVIFGNVVSSNLGQAPARQAAIGAGLKPSVICTTINKVCSSGLKTIMLAANEIRLGQADVIIAGGMESMSNIPYYLPTLRNGARIGDSPALDGLMKDGLTDAYGKYPMGNCAEVCANEMKITREMQDTYAKSSYEKAQKATQQGKFTEIIPVEIKSKKGVTIVKDDEEPFKVQFDKLSTLKPAFKNPTDASASLSVTAANSSVLSDGSAALVLVSGKYAKTNNLNVKAKVLSYADYEQEPIWFTTAPAKAIPKALASAGLQIDDVSKFELNEAFSVVALANQALLGVPDAKINVYGGAVALGHPLGASGARIVTTLMTALENEPVDSATGRNIGVASLCNGGGGASAIVIEKL